MTLPAADGERLPASRWLPAGPPRGVVLALHGFAEYRGGFYTLGPRLAEAGYAVYAYDQRGFGQTARRGYWPGRAQLVADARTVLAHLRDRYPGRPVHLLGHSMGGAVAMLAVTGEAAVTPASTILVAPAVHGWESLPLLQRWALQVGNALFPGWRPQQRWGQRLADIRVTDDPWVQLVQAGDPDYLRAIRVDMIHGVVTLMDRALAVAGGLPARTLVLYGGRDDLVPRTAFCNLLARLPAPPAGPRVALYPDGHHYLLRDLQREAPLRDIVAWLEAGRRPTTVGAAVSREEARDRLCAAGG
ncbi:alpha/beta fold hydrolase [Spiribacter halobius]|nr:alpha/beta fold hydrolase [Spiribacter halobius]UEX76204.1 alpha/beta hydrolase [Spiribacter halobius]